MNFALLLSGHCHRFIHNCFLRIAVRSGSLSCSSHCFCGVLSQSFSPVTGPCYIVTNSNVERSPKPTRQQWKARPERSTVHCPFSEPSFGATVSFSQCALCRPFLKHSSSPALSLSHHALQLYVFHSAEKHLTMRPYSVDI